jgi:beta-lactam-binding protein with PASTA domain
MPDVPVPDFTGLTRADAETALTNAGLVVGTVSTTSSPAVPAGSIISSNPASSTLVAPGSTVNLEVSSGPAPEVAVPNVTGLTRTAAETALRNAGLMVGEVRQVSSYAVPAGGVSATSPAGGTL